MQISFLLPTMPESMILEPLKESHFDEDKVTQIKKNWEKVKHLLDEMKYGEI